MLPSPRSLRSQLCVPSCHISSASFFRLLVYLFDHEGCLEPTIATRKPHGWVRDVCDQQTQNSRIGSLTSYGYCGSFCPCPMLERRTRRCSGSTSIGSTGLHRPCTLRPLLRMHPVEKSSSYVIARHSSPIIIRRLSVECIFIRAPSHSQQKLALCKCARDHLPYP